MLNFAIAAGIAQSYRHVGILKALKGLKQHLKPPQSHCSCTSLTWWDL